MLVPADIYSNVYREKLGLNIPVFELPRTLNLPPCSIVRCIGIGSRSKFTGRWREI